MKVSARRIRSGVVAVVALLSACAPPEAKEAGLGPDGNPVLTAVSVAPTAVTLTAGAAQAFSVSGTLDDGETITPPVTWSANSGIITSSGNYTAPSVPGTYRVIATVVGDDLADTSTVTVPAAPVTLSALSIVPGTVSLQTGVSQQFSISALWSDGSTSLPPVSYSATGGTVDGNGLFVAGGTPGTFRVIVAHNGGTLRDTATVTIQAPPAVTLTNLILVPGSVSLQIGASQQFAVAATWSDGSTATPAVVWTATGGTIDAQGEYTAGSTAGTFRVIARHAASGRADTSAVTIQAPPAATLTVLSMTPASVSLNTGATQQFAITAQWSDGSTSLPPVSYTATGGTITAGGLYTAGSTAGTFRVIVTHTASGLADTSNVTLSVPAPTLTSVSMTPATVSLLTGATQQFTTTALWSDGGTTVPTLTYNATGGTITTGGLYTAGGTAGTYRVIVSANGRADTSSVTITVPAATLSSLTMTPASVSLSTGGTQQFTTTALWSDGGTSVPALTYSATGGTVTAGGLYTAGNTAGTYRVIVSANGRADTSSITVTASAPTLSSLTMTPASVSLNTGATQMFTVTALWSDGSTTVPAVTFSATGGSVVQNGQYTAGNTAGTFRVIVSGSGRADTSAVTITSAPAPTPVSMAINPGSASLSNGGQQQFSAVVTMSNGSTTTPTVTWSATGGTITTGGLYTAGSTDGTYRVIANYAAAGLLDTVQVTIATAPPGSLYPNRPASYTRVVDDVNMSMNVPAGGGSERMVGSTPWSVIYDDNGSGGSTFTRIDDATAPQSATSVWQLRWPAGTWTDGHGSGNIGRPLPSVTKVYVSYWIKWDAQFEFHPISSKHLRFEKSNGNFLLQASHDNTFLRASDEGIGQAYEPQDGSKPALGVWHHIEVVVETGSPGMVKVWLDGQLRTNYSNLPVSGPFTTISFDGHLGGGGMTKVRDSFTWMDHIFIATP